MELRTPQALLPRFCRAGGENESLGPTQASFTEASARATSQTSVAPAGLWRRRKGKDLTSARKKERTTHENEKNGEVRKHHTFSGKERHGTQTREKGHRKSQEK